MRSSLFATLALSLLSVATVVAAAPRELITRVGVVESAGELKILTAPRSTLLVRIDCEIEDFEVGVYARYAQRYLGVQTPLVAKKRASIVGASIALAPEDSYIADADFAANLAPEVVASHVEMLPVDHLSSQVVTAERSAANAAEEIFWIRQLRTDLLSGELGEGYYAAGLDAALKRLDQQESALTELFMGRTTTTRVSKVFEIPLEGNTASYRVCRFSPTNGIVDVSDVSEELIMLSIKVADDSKINVGNDKSDDKSKVLTYRVASPAKCELMTQDKSLTSSIIPLFEFGYNLNYVVPSKK